MKTKKTKQNKKNMALRKSLNIINKYLKVFLKGNLYDLLKYNNKARTVKQKHLILFKVTLGIFGKEQYSLGPVLGKQRQEDQVGI